MAEASTAKLQEARKMSAACKKLLPDESPIKIKKYTTQNFKTLFTYLRPIYIFVINLRHFKALNFVA